MQSIQRIQRKNVLKQTLFDRYEITELWKEFFFFLLSTRFWLSHKLIQ